MSLYRLIVVIALICSVALCPSAEAARRHADKHHRALRQAKKLANKSANKPAVAVVLPSTLLAAPPVTATAAPPTSVSIPVAPAPIPVIVAPDAPSADLKARVMDYNNKIGEAQDAADAFDANAELARGYKKQAKEVQTVGYWRNGAIAAMPGSPAAEEVAVELLDKAGAAAIQARAGLDNCNVCLYQALKLWNGLLDDPATKAGMEHFYIRGPHAVDVSYIKKDYQGFGLENLRVLTTHAERPAEP